MELFTSQNGSKVTVAVAGRLDSLTSPALESKLAELLTAEVKDFELDLGKLDYVSSAGLRVILSAQKKMSKQGRMTVVHVLPTVMEVFDMTGFSSVLTIVP